MFGGTTIAEKTGSAITLEKIGDVEFRQIQNMMRDHVGIVLRDNKKALVEARMNKRLRALNITSYNEYLKHLSVDESGQEFLLLIDAISTNVTDFFREADHFHFLSQQVEWWITEGRRKLRFWCAACSSGEEPYSMLMTMSSIREIEGIDIKILATDISTRVLELATRGNYAASLVEKIPVEMRNAHFQTVDRGGDHMYQVRDHLKKQILFKRLNLNKTPYPINSTFDMIFCRNVMIYFDKELRDRIIAEAYRLLNPGGFLVIGHAETLLGMERKFRFIKPSVYRRR